MLAGGRLCLWSIRLLMNFHIIAFPADMLHKDMRTVYISGMLLPLNERLFSSAFDRNGLEPAGKGEWMRTALEVFIRCSRYVLR